MYVDLRYRYAHSALHIEFDEIHDAVGHRGDARAIFDNHMYIYDDLVIFDAHIHTVSSISGCAAALGWMPSS